VTSNDYRATARKVLIFLRRLGPAGPLALIAASTPAISGFLLLGSIYWFAPWLRAHPAGGMLVYVVGYMVLGGLALMPTYAHSVLGGWAFGFKLGFPLAMAAFLGAAALAYVIGRCASGERIVRIIDEHPKGRAVRIALIGRGFFKTLLIVTLLRLPPTSPFAITNLAMAATRVHPLAFLIGTAIGMAPRTGAVVFLAAGLSELDFAAPKRPWLFVAGIVVTMLVLAIIGYIANQAITRVTGTAEPKS